MAKEEKESSIEHCLLDSSLIRPTANNKKIYNAKLIKCGKYCVQLYNYSEMKIKKDDTYCNLKDDKDRVVAERDEKGNKPPTTAKLKEIRDDNALRSKLGLERLVKANGKRFESFITLSVRTERL